MAHFTVSNGGEGMLSVTLIASRADYGGSRSFGGLCGSLLLRDDPVHRCIAILSIADSFEPGGSSICLCFTSPQHPIGNSPDRLLFGWPIWGAWRLHGTAAWSAFLRGSDFGGRQSGKQN